MKCQSTYAQGLQINASKHSTPETEAMAIAAKTNHIGCAAEGEQKSHEKRKTKYSCSAPTHADGGTGQRSGGGDTYLSVRQV